MAAGNTAHSGYAVVTRWLLKGSDGAIVGVWRKNKCISMNPNILGINWWFQLGVKMDMKRNKRFLVENLLFVRAEYVQFVSRKQGVALLMEFL